MKKVLILSLLFIAIVTVTAPAAQALDRREMTTCFGGTPEECLRAGIDWWKEQGGGGRGPNRCVIYKRKGVTIVICSGPSGDVIGDAMPPATLEKVVKATFRLRGEVEETPEPLYIDDTEIWYAVDSDPMPAEVEPFLPDLEQVAEKLDHEYPCGYPLMAFVLKDGVLVRRF